MTKPKILVTGVTSLVGWNLFQEASKVCFTWGTHNEKAKPIWNQKILCLNIENRQAVLECVRKICPEIIFHCSAICALGHCEKKPQKAFAINVKATQNLLQAAEEVGARFIFLSTDLVFDGCNPPFCEEHQPKPLSYFGKTKALAEELVLKSPVDFLIARVALNIGFSVQGTKGASDWILSRLAKGQPVTLYEDEFRCPIESSLLAEMLLQLSLSDQRGILHIAGKDRVSRYELGCRLLSSKGLPPELLHAGTRLDAPWPPRPHDLTLDCSKLCRVLGISLPTLEDSLERMFPYSSSMRRPENYGVSSAASK